jgi:signal transduction histidine kinase
MTRGGRLDQRPDGAGLGLSIVQDVLAAYDRQLVLEASSLGGLRATF